LFDLVFYFELSFSLSFVFVSVLSCHSFGISASVATRRIMFNSHNVYTSQSHSSPIFVLRHFKFRSSTTCVVNDQATNHVATILFIAIRSDTRASTYQAHQGISRRR
jgi:hypothetical protein